MNEHRVSVEEVGPSPYGDMRLVCTCGWTKVVPGSVEKPVVQWATEHVQEATR